MTCNRVLSKFAVVITIVCALWSLGFILFGATASGKSWYANLSSNYFSDTKGGVPILTLCIPVLVATTTAVLCHVRLEPTTATKIDATSQRLSIFYRFSLFQRIQQCKNGHGDLNFNRFARNFVFFPLLVYLFSNIYRHFHGNELTYDDKIMEISNAFAFGALIAMSFFLIPVARTSPILRLLHWDEASAVRLHIWSGRIIVLGVLIHGIMHMYRWTNIAGENLVAMLIPPRPCWTLQDTDFEPTCNDDDTDCSCYYLFRNLTGFLAAIGLVVIGFTSLNYLRRNHYRVFYMAHVWTAPTVLIMTILHWRRSILYMAPSLLYYTATSTPILMERLMKNCKRRDVGVKIVSVKYIASSDKHHPCVSLTLLASDEAVLCFEPGQYGKLLVCDVSNISHPFTINRVPGKVRHLRIIFRATGPFTRQLAHALTSGSNLPTICLEGFYGNTNRVRQLLKHDVAVLVAGGIGITPYLSLLHQVTNNMNGATQAAAAAARLQHDGVVIEPTTTKEIVLHWMCRDPDLVKYVKAQYFDSLRWNAPKSGYQVRLIVHCTNARRSSDVTATANGLDSTNDEQVAQELHISSTANDGNPIAISRFTCGASTSLLRNMLPFLTFTSTAWTGLWATWTLYLNKTHNHEIVGRGWAAFAICSIAVVVSLVANAGVGIVDKFQGQQFHHDLIENTEEERDIEMESVSQGIAKQPLVGDDGGVVSEDNKPVADGTSLLDVVSYEEREGRPSVHELLKPLDGAQCPGLFICGPKKLTQPLREASKERCQIRIRHCISGTPQIAVYEESFTL